MTDEDVVTALLGQLPDALGDTPPDADPGTPEVDLRYASIPGEVAQIIPKEICLKHQAMPVAFDDDLGQLTVAMADASDLNAVDELRFAAQRKVKRVMTVPAARPDLERLWHEHFNFDRRSVKRQQLDLSSTFKPISAHAATESSITQLVDSIFGKAVELGTSDVHFDVFSTEASVRFRIDGVLYKVLSIPADVYPKVVSRIKVLARLDISEKRATQEGRIALQDPRTPYELRVSILPVFNGERIAVRLFDRTNFSFGIEALGIRGAEYERFQRELDKPNGLVLITGPTGSGKTTTLYSMINHLNDLSRNIITIEDPVEFSFEGIGQAQVDERNELTFAAVLRSVLRQDPNVIMIGEIRDEETALIATRAALTGHLVLATAHTNDAPTAIARLMNMGIKPYLIASALNIAVAQRLLRKVCTQCRVEDEANPEHLLRLGLTPVQISEGTFYRGKGCRTCSFTGYKGREGIFEILVLSSRMRELITKNASVADLKRQAGREHMTPLVRAGLAKAAAGDTTIAEVMRHAYYEGS